MIYASFFLICFIASVVGAICGIGGGVIIKPALDAFGILGVSAISFLSGCTVLAMSAYSVIKSASSGHSAVDRRVGVPLAVGGAAGGLLGKELFNMLAALSANQDRVGAVQAACLLVITLGTLIYTVNKDRIPTHRIKGILPCLLIGVALGVFSSFLGIGGGPINLVVLFFFFSMPTRAAAENSLYIILFSQVASLASSLLRGNVPQFSPWLLLLMICGGIGGGICGRAINKNIDDRKVDRLFIALMAVIIAVNIYNMVRFLM